MPLGAHRTGRTIKAECCHRGNIIGESHRVLSPGDRRSAVTKNTSYEAYDISKVLPPGNIINGSHRVLLSGDKRNAVIKNTSYGAYDIGKILPSKEYYKRKL